MNHNTVPAADKTNVKPNIILKLLIKGLTLEETFKCSASLLTVSITKPKGLLNAINNTKLINENVTKPIDALTQLISAVFSPYSSIAFVTIQ